MKIKNFALLSVFGIISALSGAYKAEAGSCNVFGCSPSNVPCNPFGCPNPNAGEYTPFGCPPSPTPKYNSQPRIIIQKEEDNTKLSDNSFKECIDLLLYKTHEAAGYEPEKGYDFDFLDSVYSWSELKNQGLYRSYGRFYHKSKPVIKMATGYDQEQAIMLCR